MPTFETHDRRQWAVLWEKSGVDEYGRATVAPGVEVRLRWVDTNRMGSDSQGEPVAISADLTMDRSVEIGSVMWKGRFRDMPGTSRVPASNVMTVVSCNVVPDLKNRHTRYNVSLTRRNDKLPELY